MNMSPYSAILCIPFRYIIYSGERATDVFVVPVLSATSFPDVKHEEVHLVDVIVHRFCISAFGGKYSEKAFERRGLHDIFSS